MEQKFFDHLWTNLSKCTTVPIGTHPFFMENHRPTGLRYMVKHHTPIIIQICSRVVPWCHNRCKKLQHCPRCTTLSTFTESIRTEIAKYIHCAILHNQIPIIGIRSASHNGRLVKPTSEWYFIQEVILTFWISKVIFIHDQGNCQWPRFFQSD